MSQKNGNSRLLAWAALCCSLGACAQVDPRADYDQAWALVEASSGGGASFDPSVDLPSMEAMGVDLEDGLSLEEAQRLALVHSRELHAAFQEIGISRAQLTQAGLLSNPSLDLLMRVPTAGGGSTLEALLGLNLLEIWRLPLRKQQARQELAATVLRVARRAGEQLGRAERAYFEAVAADELFRLANDNLTLSQRAFEAVNDLRSAGAADALEASLAEGAWLTAQLGLSNAQLTQVNARRELANTLSIEASIAAVELTDALPESLDEWVLDEEALVRLAFELRLDLQALTRAMQALEASVGYERRKAWGEASAGAVFQEQGSPAGEDVVGPSLGLTLPIFDQNRAQIALVEHRWKQLNSLRAAAQVEIAQSVRANVGRVRLTQGNLRLYNGALLPQAQRVLALAEGAYSAGSVNLLTLLGIQRQLLEAQRGQVAVRLEAAVSIADLEQALGRRLSGPVGAGHATNL